MDQNGAGQATKGDSEGPDVRRSAVRWISAAGLVGSGGSGSGGLQGQRGYFSRDEHGAITGVDLAGRLFARTH